MAQKYFAWSFDDGLEQDKRIIKTLKKYGMGATFHLNSGLFGDRTYEGRIGNLGLTEMPAARYEAKRHHLLPYAEHFRIPEDEVREVYTGFEIASHTLTHVNLAKCSEEKRREEIEGDVAALSSLTGQPVTGFAYPYGIGAKQCGPILRGAGIRYARTVKTDTGFRFPADALALPMTSWHISPKALSLIESFAGEDPGDEDMFFLMFAHGYEFDFGTKESNWEKFERICETVSKQKDILCCSIGEAFRLHNASGLR